MGGFNFRLGTYNVPEGPSANPYGDPKGRVVYVEGQVKHQKLNKWFGLVFVVQVDSLEKTMVSLARVTFTT